MELSDWDAHVARTTPQGADLLILAALGMNGEAGEFADAVKKLRFHHPPADDGTIPDADAAALATELGDVLWYVGLAAKAVGKTLEEIAEQNVTKLAGRYPDGFARR